MSIADLLLLLLTAVGPASAHSGAAGDQPVPQTSNDSNVSCDSEVKSAYEIQPLLFSHNLPLPLAHAIVQAVNADSNVKPLAPPGTMLCLLERHSLQQTCRNDPEDCNGWWLFMQEAVPGPAPSTDTGNAPGNTECSFSAKPQVPHFSGPFMQLLPRLP